MPPPSAAPDARILVVDDELSIRQLLSESFGDDGYEVRTASNGSDALHLIAGWRPDLIVLDLMMPTMNGWQFAEAYGAQPGPHTPVVVVTAAGPGAIQSAEHLGTISAVLAKPLDLDELHDLVALHLRERT